MASPVDDIKQTIEQNVKGKALCLASDVFPGPIRTAINDYLNGVTLKLNSVGTLKVQPSQGKATLNMDPVEIEGDQNHVTVTVKERTITRGIDRPQRQQGRFPGRLGLERADGRQAPLEGQRALAGHAQRGPLQRARLDGGEFESGDEGNGIDRLHGQGNAYLQGGSPGFGRPPRCL